MDNRYNETIPPDSPVLTAGDEQIVGMDARTQPERLAPGYAQYLQNQRLPTLAPMTRKGMAKQTNSIAPLSEPLYIPFYVGSGASSTITGTTTDGLFASWVFSDPYNSNNLYLFLVTSSQLYTFASSSSTVTTIAYPANEIVETSDPYTDIFQVGGSVYIVRGDLGTSISFTSITGTISSSTATVTCPVATGLSTNMYVRVGGDNSGVYNGDFQITVTGQSTFTYSTATALTSGAASGSVTVNRLKTPMVWSEGVNGAWASAFTLNSYGVVAQNFFNMPVSDFGLLQQNRVIMEYNRNAIIMSQINGPSAYDTINGVFDFAVGTNDYLVGVSPYQDTQTLVFMRYSIWLVNYVNGDVAAMTSQVVVPNLGCASRHSIATCGSNILFLNEKGVYMMQPGFELTLRGNSLPLSAPMDPYIQTINFAAINKAWAAYHNNRYYLAIPVNGSARNNAMIVYNFINSAWESYDTFPNGFYCDQMQVMLNANGFPTLYLISFEGGIYAAEQNEMDDFAAANLPATQYLINGQFRTRRMSFGTTGLKRFSRVVTVAQMDGSSTLAATAYTTNPEDTKILATITNANATSGQTTRPSLVNKRAYALEILYANTSGRCQVVNYNAGAYIQDQKSIAQN